MCSEYFKEERMKVVLTKPLSFEEDSNDDKRGSKVLKGILSILKDVRPGSDLTKLQLPPQFNVPKSHLQFYGESLYCVGRNMLEKCNVGANAIERFIAVIAFNISNLRPWAFGSGPYNPILGETHHVSRGTLNVLIEQISHHPPVTGVHATDEKDGIELIWCQHPVPKYYGTWVVLQLHGKRELKLMRHGETYVMNSPNVVFKFFPIPRVDYSSSQRIQCHESGLEAQLSFGGNSFFGIGRNHRAVKGKIFESASRMPLFEINGQWDKTVTLQDLNTRKTRVIYDAKEVISDLQTPTVVDVNGVWPTESAAVWSEVSKGIISRDWGIATHSKKAVEENQRKLLRERQSRGENWVPKHFTVSYSKEAGWDCSPIQKVVPKAPIVVPSNTL